MCRRGAPFSGRLGSAMLTVGLNLKSVFQPKLFYNYQEESPNDSLLRLGAFCIAKSNRRQTHVWKAKLVEYLERSLDGI